ncbi:transmembrane protein 69-like [Lytechinus pictus]|uniref:transmembrane protein 69-like n=1 Tax=Lytechinus pictus TaxID=7653 RepID=UPI0030B9FD89
MLPHKIKLLSSGRNILSRISSEPVSIKIQRNLEGSCSTSHRIQKILVPAVRSYTTSTQTPSLKSCHYDKSSRVVLDRLQGQRSEVLQQRVNNIHSQSGISRTTSSVTSCKPCIHHYHTSARRQVINDEDGSASKESWLRKHKMQLKSAPPAALVLGFSGLIPFIAPAAYSIITFSCGPQVAFAQVAYGACILSFLGGVRWGFAISPPETPTSLSLVMSVLPSLVAWTGLSMPIQPGLVCIITGLALAGIVDSRFKSFPSWFRSLRFLLTTFAILSVSVTFGFSVLYPPPEPEHGYNFKKLIKIAQIIVQD